MLYLKSTAAVQKAIGLHKNQLSPIEPSDAPLGHWMVNRFMVERSKAYLFMSKIHAVVFYFAQWQGADDTTAFTRHTDWRLGATAADAGLAL